MKIKILFLLSVLFLQKGFTQKSISLKTNIGFYMPDSLLEKKITAFISNYLANRDSICSNQINIWTTNKNVKWRFPDDEISGIEISYDNLTPDFYKPLLLSILEVGKDTFEVKIAFLHTYKSGDTELKCIYNFIVHSEPNQFKLIPQLDFYTKDWRVKKTGDILFHFSQTHTFNTALSIKMNNFNKKSASFFNTAPIQFDYYIANNTKEMFKIKGVDYSIEMYFANQKTGRASPLNNKIFSGTGKEYYPHEVIHLYTYEKFNTDINNLFIEGLATYLGGSQGFPLLWHLKKLKQYLISNPAKRLYGIFDNNFIIGEKTNVLYTIGGLICKVVYEKQGKKALFKMVENSFDTDTSNKRLFSFLGITKTNLHQFIVNELAKL